MTAYHHPSDQSIFSYANGSLGRTLALVMGAHVESCAQCRQALDLAETLGGVFLDSEQPVELPANVFSNVLERLEIPQAQSRTAPRALPSFSLRHQDAGPRRWLMPGIWIRPILKDGDDRAYLLGAAPGKALLRHGHKGMEMTQVLEGEFFDGGTRYGPGDFLEADDEVEHTLRVGANAMCVCVIASQGVPKGLPGLLMRLIA
jgi:putative transcriptional regulator